ncbi:hypothetical protein [uncultured Nisaea sp.]|uniref:hypothetical protein n=1 Tax=uncultured Nisaea sp. TaxID=538215 RepID=UPI0030EEE944|tara:strand:- start:687 stop:1523 length:837 start_codon:yes stop_codon:yes gene_type:complete
MKRLGIIVGAGVALLLVAVVGVVVFVFGNLDSLVKDVIEEQGTRVAGVPVSVSGVKIEVLDGRAGINGLAVGNPSGFKSDSAISLGGISMALDTASVSQPVIVIKEITVDEPAVTYELMPGGNNIGIIAGNVKKNSGGGSSSSGATSSGESGGTDKKLIIETLKIRGGKVMVAASLLDQGKALEARLPDITLRNIGKDSGGATPGEVAAEVMAALTDAASRAAASIGVGKTLEALKQNIGNINGGKLPTDAEGAKQAVDDAKKELEKAGEGLKKLFGN